MRLPLRVAIVASCIASFAATAQAQSPASSPDSTVAAYCAAWSTADGSAREQLLERVWAPDGVYADPAPTYAVGRGALSEVIGKLQQQQSGARFQCSTPQVHHGMMRFTWVFSAGGREQARGMDFGELAADGRIRRITGFFGPPPAVSP